MKTPARTRADVVRRLVAAITETLVPGTLQLLSPSERLYIHKPYKGVEAPAATLARLAIEDPSLNVANVEPEEMLDSVVLLDDLAKARALMMIVVRAIDDTSLVVR